MIDYTPVPKQVFTAEQAVEFLQLDSLRSLKRLVETGRLCPLKLGKSNTFAVAELQALVDRELEQQRRTRDISRELS